MEDYKPKKSEPDQEKNDQSSKQQEKLDINSVSSEEMDTNEDLPATAPSDEEYTMYETESEIVVYYPTQTPGTELQVEVNQDLVLITDNGEVIEQKIPPANFRQAKAQYRNSALVVKIPKFPPRGNQQGNQFVTQN